MKQSTLLSNRMREFFRADELSCQGPRRGNEARANRAPYSNGQCIFIGRLFSTIEPIVRNKVIRVGFKLTCRTLSLVISREPIQSG